MSSNGIREKRATSCRCARRNFAGGVMTFCLSREKPRYSAVASPRCMRSKEERRREAAACALALVSLPDGGMTKLCNRAAAAAACTRAATAGERGAASWKASPLSDRALATSLKISSRPRVVKKAWRAGRRAGGAETIKQARYLDGAAWAGGVGKGFLSCGGVLVLSFFLSSAHLNGQ